MRPKALVFICILCTAVVLILGSCATMRSPDKMTYERFCGTWANQDYEPKPGTLQPYAKWIINPDGTFVSYSYLVQTGPAAAGTYVVEKRWTDSLGNSFYHVKAYFYENDSTWYELCKIDNHNAVFECNYSNIDYPAAIDPKDMHSSYEIYYRY